MKNTVYAYIPTNNDDFEGFAVFSSAEEAWFWYCRNRERNPLAAKREKQGVEKVCQIDDIYVCLSRLYLARQIGRAHIDALMKFGDMQIVPDGRIEVEERDAALWEGAMKLLTELFVEKRIVLCATA
ncbi:MAG: hypothetical protein FWD15_04920 [Alphaproteobacteria bacterium]|nr:hypothetical protein [Alphaproteobacteria bacterium]